MEMNLSSSRVLCERRMDPPIRAAVESAVSKEVQLQTSAEDVLGSSLTISLKLIGGVIETYLPEDPEQRTAALRMLHADLIINLNDVFRDLRENKVTVRTVEN